MAWNIEMTLLMLLAALYVRVQALEAIESQEAYPFYGLGQDTKRTNEQNPISYDYSNTPPLAMEDVVKSIEQEELLVVAAPESTSTSSTHITERIIVLVLMNDPRDAVSNHTALVLQWLLADRNMAVFCDEDLQQLQSQLLGSLSAPAEARGKAVINVPIYDSLLNDLLQCNSSQILAKFIDHMNAVNSAASPSLMSPPSAPRRYCGSSRARRTARGAGGGRNRAATQCETIAPRRVSSYCRQKHIVLLATPERELTSAACRLNPSAEIRVLTDHRSGRAVRRYCDFAAQGNDVFLIDSYSNQFVDYDIILELYNYLGIVNSNCLLLL